METKKCLYILFLVTLIAFKVSAAHIYSHEDQYEGHIFDCELCEHAIYNQSIEFSPLLDFHSIEIDLSPAFYLHESKYEGVYVETPVNNARFGRPPPSQS